MQAGSPMKRPGWMSQQPASEPAALKKKCVCASPEVEDHQNEKKEKERKERVSSVTDIFNLKLKLKIPRREKKGEERESFLYQLPTVYCTLLLYISNGRKRKNQFGWTTSMLHCTCTDQYWYQVLV